MSSNEETGFPPKSTLTSHKVTRHEDKSELIVEGVVGLPDRVVLVVEMLPEPLDGIVLKKAKFSVTNKCLE